MRALASFLLALLIVGLTSVDPLICPDGCTDEPIGHAPSAPAGAGQCALCAGLQLTPRVLTNAPVARLERTAPPPVPAIASADLPDIDHPPRLA